MKTDGVIAPTQPGPNGGAEADFSSRLPGEGDSCGQPDLEAIDHADPRPNPNAVAGQGDAPTTLTLTLGDFLPRLPAEIIRPEQRDPLLPVEIPLSQLALSLLKGRTTVPIAEIFAAQPQIFVEGVLAGPPIEIVYPWRRIVALLKESSGSETFGRSLLSALAASRKAASAPKPEGARSAPLARTVLRGRKMPDGQMSWFSAQPASVRTANSIPSTVPTTAAPCPPPMNAELSSADANPTAAGAAILPLAESVDLTTLGMNLDPVGLNGHSAPVSHTAVSPSGDDEAKLPDLSIVLRPAGATDLPMSNDALLPSIGDLTSDDSTGNASPTPAEMGRELARLSGERDSIMAQLDEHSAAAARERADLQREHESIIATLMSEHEEALRAARAEHEREQSEQTARLAEQTSITEWNARTIASLEADVETYRQRIKAVLQERDALRTEKEALSRELGTSSESAPATAFHDAPAEALDCCGPAESARCRGCTHDFSVEEISTQGGVYDVAR